MEKLRAKSPEKRSGEGGYAHAIPPSSFKEYQNFSTNPHFKNLAIKFLTDWQGFNNFEIVEFQNLPPPNFLLTWGF